MQMKAKLPYHEADRPQCHPLPIPAGMDLLVTFSTDASLYVWEDPNGSFEEYDPLIHEED